MVICVIGVDPGNVTGISKLTVEDDWRVVAHVLEVDAAEAGFALQRMIQQSATAPRRVAVERFQPGTRKTAQPAASHVIGAVRSICRAHDIDLTTQSASAARKIAPKSFLAKLRVNHPTRDGHADDATSHALLCLAELHPDEFMKLREA